MGDWQGVCRSTARIWPRVRGGPLRPDLNPNPSGWITDNDLSGGENGDKCDWKNGYSTIVNLNGSNFAVQSLWSNNDSNGVGGCVAYYGSPTDQH